jgi:FkbH-like protein
MQFLARALEELTQVEVIIAGFTEVELVERLKPDLIYVDVFTFDTVAPLTVSAATGHPLPELDLRAICAVVQRLKGSPVVYRGLRRPSAGAFGLVLDHPELARALDKLAACLEGELVLDVQGLWAREGIPMDDRAMAMGHCEYMLDDGAEVPAGARAEGFWLYSLWATRIFGPIKCVVVDLDETLIEGEIVADDFHRRNPAWLPRGELLSTSALEAWFELRQGFLEALHIVRRRGIQLALATRNDPEVVSERFRRRPPTALAPEHSTEVSRPRLEPASDAQRAHLDRAQQRSGRHGWMYDTLPDLRGASSYLARMVEQLALDYDDFVCVEAGFGPKSQMCKSIADRLGIGLDSLAFIDDSPMERAEVQRNAPGVMVIDGTLDQLRQVLLLGPRMNPWRITEDALRRERSYRSRAATVAADSLDDFLHDLKLQIASRVATERESARVQELFARTHQLNLTGIVPEFEPSDRVYVGWCGDRLADHGLVSAGVVRAGRLLNWVCSCRVLPHRVAASLLHLLLAAEPGLTLERVATRRNGATTGLIEEARRGLAPWVSVVSAPDARMCREPALAAPLE